VSGHTHVGLQVVHGSSGLLLYSEAKPTCTGVYGELLLCNSPEAGKSHSFGGQYLELVPHEPIRLTDRFDDPNLPGEIQLTVTLKKVLGRD
jgi:Activator of Hsp90 ATPase homolog 1-like protein